VRECEEGRGCLRKRGKESVLVSGGEGESVCVTEIVKEGVCVSVYVRKK
jgi:hypothetical protein